MFIKKKKKKKKGGGNMYGVLSTSTCGINYYLNWTVILGSSYYMHSDYRHNYILNIQVQP